MGNDTSPGIQYHHPKFAQCQAIEDPKRLRITLEGIDPLNFERWQQCLANVRPLNFRAVLLPSHVGLLSDWTLCDSRKRVQLDIPFLPNQVLKLVEERRALRKPFEERELTFFLRQMAAVIDELLQVDYQPSHLHPANILFSDDGSFSLIAAFSLPLDTQGNSWAEQHAYDAPEQLENRAKRLFFEKCGEAAYVFQLGMTCLHLAGLDSCEGVYDRNQHKVLWGVLALRLEQLRVSYSPQLLGLLQACLAQAPAARPDRGALRALP
jgi:hypothetical protein